MNSLGIRHETHAASGRRTWSCIAEELLIALTLLAMALIPVIEFLGRKFFNTGIPGATHFLRHGTLLLGFVAAVAATREDRNLKISAIDAFLPKRHLRAARLFSAFVSIMACTALAWAGWLMVMAEAPSAPEWIRRLIPSSCQGFWDDRLLFSDGNEERIGGLVPVWIAEMLIPVGFMGVIVRLIQREAATTRTRLLLSAAIPLTLLVSIVFEDHAAAVVLPGFLLLFTAIAFGAPIFVLLGGSAILLFWNDGVTTAAIPAETYRIVTSEVFPAIPIFTLIGFILSESGASKRLEKLFVYWFGWMPGGIAVAVTLLCAFFTTFTGASGATILALGALLLPILVHRGFGESFSIGLLTSTGSIGLLLPPSLVVILYAVVAQQPIVGMFRAAVVPGILMILPVVAWCVWKAHRLGVRREPFDAAGAFRSLRNAAGEISLPLVVLGLIFVGWCTPVEAAAFGAVYALIIESLVYRDLRPHQIYRLLVSGGIMVGSILIVLGVAMGLTSYLVDAGIPQQAADWVKAHVDSRWVFLLALNFALLLVGCLMDIFSALIVVVPLLLPIAAAFGVDPVHLGMIFLANLQLGYLTPPVGMNLFLASIRFERPLLTVVRDTLPFLLLNGFVVLLITYLPALTLWAIER